ncbi:MAG: glycosyltransferase family 4 protein [Planctomycetaceae bacterium]|nr:glycosyltransferase family 4 protein [Planctomycetaceae bacterium]
MRIGLVIEQLDPRRGGVEQWTWHFAQWLLRERHEVHVVARGVANTVAQSGVIVQRIEASDSRTDFAERAALQLRLLQLDVVHDTGCGWYSDIFQPHGGSRVASFEQNLFLTPHWLRGMKRTAVGWLPRYREFDRLAARQYDDPRRIYLAISRMVAADLQRYHHVRPEQVRIVYNGVDCERFSPAHRVLHRARVRDELGVADDETLCLIVAHNFRLKGVPTLIRATGHLVQQGARVRLAIVGGRKFGEYRRLAKRVGCESAVSFLGSHDDPVPFYAAADVYVQPTFYDPCSLVVLEALASGLPTITSRFNGAGELITPNVEGSIVADPADDRELAEHLSRVLDASRRMEMGQAARELALDHTWERNCREILNLYREISPLRQAA